MIITYKKLVVKGIFKINFANKNNTPKIPKTKNIRIDNFFNKNLNEDLYLLEIVNILH